MLFNTIFDYAVFPSNWRLRIITFIFKKGRRNNPSNYRGISVLSSLGKVLTGILITRIVRRIEEKFILSESQAGFRKDRSTVDHIFVLKTILDKFLTRKKGSFCCLFVDFSKAFDYVTEITLLTRYAWKDVETIERYVLKCNGISENKAGLYKTI